MPIVTANRLRRFMSNPRWSPEQTEVADDLCAEMESTLEHALGATFISPRPMVERAPVIGATGLIDTSYPVFALRSIDSTVIDDDDPLPPEYRITNGRLFRQLTSITSSASPYADAPFVPVSGLTSWAGAWNSTTTTSGGRYSGEALVSYLAGWGPEPALINAILRKAAAFMQNRHSDVVVAQGLDGAAPPGPATEEWTPAELANLGRFRRLHVGGT